MIIYEDKDLIVINKPAGLLVHAVENQKTDEKTLVDFLLEKYPEIKNVGDTADSEKSKSNIRPGIVHRLDKETSGIMVVARNQKSFEFLKKQFAERKVKKTYIALLAGKLNPPAGGKIGVINLPIGRSKSSPTKRLASQKARGKLREAITEYKVLENFGKYTLVEVYPKTGRTHQVRVHFKAIYHPIACDKLYVKNADCPFGLSRHFLHAYSIELTLPNGGRSRFEADLPNDLEKVLKELRKI